MGSSETLEETKAQLVERLNSFRTFFFDQLKPLLNIISHCKEIQQKHPYSELRNAHTHLYWCYQHRENPDVDQIVRGERHFKRTYLDSVKVLFDHFHHQMYLNYSVENAERLKEISEEAVMIAILPIESKEDPPVEKWKKVILSIWDLYRESFEVDEKLVSLFDEFKDSYKIENEKSFNEDEIERFVERYGVLIKAETKLRLFHADRVDNWAEDHFCLLEYFLRGDIEKYVKTIDDFITAVNIAHHRHENDKMLAVGVLKDKKATFKEKTADLDGKSEDEISESIREVLHEHVVEKEIVKIVKPEFKEVFNKLFLDLTKGDDLGIDEAYQWFKNEAWGETIINFNRCAKQLLEINKRFNDEARKDRDIKRQRDQKGIHKQSSEKKDEELKNLLYDQYKQGINKSQPIPNDGFYAVMFCDINGFSQMSLEDAERNVTILQGLYEIYTDTSFLKAQPVFANTWGDALILVHADCSSLFQLAKRLYKDTGGILSMGLDYGLVKFKENKIIGAFDVSGYCVNRAARLEPMSKGHGILISEDFKGELDSDDGLEPINLNPLKNYPYQESPQGLVELKGEKHSIPVFKYCPELKELT